ncbi:MAG: T9SS type A sorting domain-containing protein, partial [Bacteroidetes bacterium]
DLVTGTLKFTANPISLGNAPSQDRTFDGAIDEVRLYDKALTAGEVQGVYNKVLTAPVAPLSFTASQTNVSCNGGSNGTAAVAAAGGNPPYTYSWSNGGTNSQISNLTSQTCTVTIMDAKGCSTANTANITQPAVLANSLAITSPACGNNNGSVTALAAGGVSPYAYSWSSGNTEATVTGLTGSQTQTLIVTLTDANNCILKDTALVSCVTGVANYDLQNQFVIYPNPNNGEFQVSDIKYQVSSIEIYNVFGEKVYSEKILNPKSLILNLDLPGGIYFLQMKTWEGNINKKIIIQK